MIFSSNNSQKTPYSSSFRVRQKGELWCVLYEFNSLWPGGPWWNFRWVLFKPITRRMSLDLTDGKSTLMQVMAWCRQATSHYLSQCWPRSMTPYGVTRPQWVKASASFVCNTVLYWTLIMMTSSNGNIFHITSPLCGEFTSNQWIPLTKASNADVSFDLRLNKHLSNQSLGWWFEMPLCPLWHHSNVYGECKSTWSHTMIDLHRMSSQARTQICQWQKLVVIPPNCGTWFVQWL